MKKLILMTLLIATHAQANSLTEFHGKLVSISEKDIVVQVEKTTYFIKKSALSPEDLKSASKVGKVITVYAPLEAIDAVKRGQSI